MFALSVVSRISTSEASGTMRPCGEGSDTPSSRARPGRPERSVRSMMDTGVRPSAVRSRPAWAPAPAMRSSKAIISGLMPASAAFSRSTVYSSLGCGASTNQSTSTMPGVASNTARTCCATSSWRCGSGP